MLKNIFEDLRYLAQVSDEAEHMPLISVTDDEEPSASETYPDHLPILALKNTVLFPGIVIPITIGRDKSVHAVKKAYDSDKYVAVLSQKHDKEEDPGLSDLYDVGTVARILKLLKMPDGTLTAILQGRVRGQLQEMISGEAHALWPSSIASLPEE